MEDIAVTRQRYPRHNVPVKRRNKKSSSTSGSYLERMMFKVLVCIVIMVVIGIIKSVNTPVTKMMCEKIKTVLMQNINLKSEYNSINDFIKKSAATTKENTKQKVQSPKDTTAKNSGQSNSPQKTSGTSAKGIEQFIAPVEGSITSPFGMRTDPFSDTRKSHSGIDLEANKGDKIKAAADGEVILAGVSKVYGNYLKIKHNNGLVTLYAHCSKIIASKGQTVRQGDIIAEVGSTGASTGSHLHFEVIKDGKAVNPIDYVTISG